MNSGRVMKNFTGTLCITPRKPTPRANAVATCASVWNLRVGAMQFPNKGRPLTPEKRLEIKRVRLIVENAANGYSELDEHVLRACGAEKVPNNFGRHRWRIHEVGIHLAPEMTRVTQSIDAALSLREEILPGWDFKLLRCDATLWTSTDAVLQEKLPRVEVDAAAATLPLAICAAILKALSALADAQAKQPV